MQRCSMAVDKDAIGWKLVPVVYYEGEIDPLSSVSDAFDSSGWPTHMASWPLLAGMGSSSEGLSTW